MANNLQRLTFIIAGLFFLSLPAGALDNFKEYRRDQWDFDLGVDYFYSEANFPSSWGSSQNLSSGNHYSLLSSNLTTRYMPRRNYALFAWGTLANAESKDSIATRTNSTFTEVAVGMDFLMYDDLFQIAPEIIVVMPLQKIEPTTDKVFNSEGVLEVRSRLIAQKDFGSWRGYGWLGFNYRGDGRSFLMPWGVGTQLKFTSARFGAELFGYQSVSEDTDKNSLVRTAYVNGVNAGSMRFYSENPSIMDSMLYATWMINSKLSLQANGGMTLMGSNAAAGFHVGGFLRYTFDLTEGYTEEPYSPPINSPVPKYRSNMYDNKDTEISSEKKVKSFKEETEDGVDQQIFKSRPTKRPPRVKDQQLQQQLDDTEFQLELKSEKKKKRRRQ